MIHTAYVDRLGSPRKIRLGDLPASLPGLTDPLVGVEPSAANPADTPEIHGCLEAGQPVGGVLVRP
ncbi:MAG: hypothetical protein ACRDYZ_13385 [Acidimicrobiales bacterium]